MIDRRLAILFDPVALTARARHNPLWEGATCRQEASQDTGSPSRLDHWHVLG